jgi:hypothetical protein
MSKKNLTIILCLVLLVSFFLPYVAGFSGFDLVFGKYKVMNNGGLASVLIPLGGILLLFGAISGNNFSTMGIIFWMPLVGIAVLILMLYLKISNLVGIGDIISSFDYGLWLSLVAAIILPFTKK